MVLANKVLVKKVLANKVLVKKVLAKKVLANMVLVVNGGSPGKKSKGEPLPKLPGIPSIFIFSFYFLNLQSNFLKE